MLNATQENGFMPSPVVGYVLKKDTAKLTRYLSLDVVKKQIPLECAL